MGKRVKSHKPDLLPVEDWQKADEYISAIGDMQQAINRSQDQSQKRIDKIKEALAADVAPRQAAIKMYVRSLEAFAESHKTEFGDKRSRALNYGTLGWRKSAAIHTTKRTLDLIKQFFAKSMRTLVHVKETVNKEALAKLTDEELAKVAARRQGRDTFFVEPFGIEAADYQK